MRSGDPNGSPRREPIEDERVDVAKLRRERDLYRRMVDLGTQNELRPFLRDALALVVEIAGARIGYLELHDDQSDVREQGWSIAHGCTDRQVEGIRAAISRGIIAQTLATGRTVLTASAILDPRFQDRGSVQLGRIEAVLCAPIGNDPPVGVVYLQGRQAIGTFTEDDREIAEFFASHLAPLVGRLVERERREPDPTRPLRDALRLEGVVGRSVALAGLLRQVALVAPLDVTVLLTGESGTGKSQLARVIHENGPRAAHPFVELNCGALPDTLIESELFGAMPGAHSTAVRRVEGKVAAAEHGTLFLDEVSDLTLSAQGKLLHLLQSRQYYPLGSAKPRAADVRVIAATNIDLRLALAERRFREDLFYRLQVLPVRVPSLEERREDIPELATFFCTLACDRHNLPRLELSRDAVRAVHSSAWPGNVRQLAHAIEAAAIRAAGGGALRVERAHVFPQLPASGGERQQLTFQEATRRFQADLLRQTLEEERWNVVEVARRLDLARSHVYNLIRAFGLERSQG